MIYTIQRMTTISKILSNRLNRPVKKNRTWTVWYIIGMGMIFFVGHDLAYSKTYTFMTEKHTVIAEPVYKRLRHPWGLAFLPDNSMLITERGGNLNLLSANGILTRIKNVPTVWAEGQGGLLDVAVDKSFSNNSTIYISYSEPSNNGKISGTAVARAILERSRRVRLRDVKVIFRQKGKTASGVHFGSRIVLAPDNSLFITVGDRGDKRRAQDKFDHAGSIIRIHPDGSVPRNNPFVEGKKALPEIWSIGHRNPQGALWHSQTNSLWTVAHGAKGGDEINRPQAGKNYGWPVITYGRSYFGYKIGEGTHKAGMEQPIYYWDPSIAPSGIAFYHGNEFPNWNGNLFVGALKYKLLVRLEITNGKVSNEERLFKGVFGRIRDVRQGPDGFLYLLTDENPGQLIRIRPVSR